MLSDAQRDKLLEIVRVGRSSPRMIKRANVLLAADEAHGGPIKQGDMGRLFNVSPATVTNILKQYAQEGLEATLTYKRPSPPNHPPKVRGEVEDALFQLVDTPPPEGHARWTLKLLTQKLVEMRIVESICPETVRTALKRREAMQLG